ncbi:MAG: GNAT family N-acetyltransferase [Clostridiales bacterium]|jgi:aminoglycoside 6'-N-acetyltransferase I|nr:GNAT family N-acetyltransferase [Clostridiales bacterium]
MSDDKSVVEYSPDYREDTKKLFYNVYKNAPFNYEWLGMEQVDEYFKDMEDTPHSLNYILMQEDKIVGVCMGQTEEHFMTPGYKINELFITGDHQSQGLGSYFMSEIENMLLKRGIKAIYLFTNRNMKAYEFYLRNNFIAHNDTVYMAKLIKPETTLLYARTFMRE